MSFSLPKFAPSPYINRFLQPDTIIPDPSNPQTWNRYSYAANNPILYNDPDGHCGPLCTAAIGFVAGAILGATISYGRQVTANISENGWSSSAFTNVNGADIAASAAVGAVAGGLIGSGVGASAGIGLIASSAGTGMATSAVGYALTAGEDYKTEGMIFSAGVGLIAGTLTGNVASTFAKPLPSCYSGCLTEAGRWAAKYALEFGINASASTAQTIGVNSINGKPTSQDEIGYSIIFGGGTGAVLDMVLPGSGGVVVGSSIEAVNNLLIDNGKHTSTNNTRLQTSAISRKLMKFELQMQ